MRYLLFFTVVVLAACQSEEKPATPQAAADTAVKKSQVKVPGEEGFEMKQYYFVMLTKGDRRDEIKDTARINEIQKGHLANINRLAKMGKIVVAGPFGDDSEWRGIFIFDCPTREEVEELLNTDPAIKAGRLNFEIHPWWTAKNEVFK